jgi:hypothetical protein
MMAMLIAGSTARLALIFYLQPNSGHQWRWGVLYRFYSSWSLLLCTLLFVSCGYRVGDHGIATRYATLSIPYVEGDSDGSLTAAIVHQVAMSGVLAYRSCSGELTLKAKVIDVAEKNVGFRYDCDRDGNSGSENSTSSDSDCRSTGDRKLTNSLIPTETRLTKSVRITLIETATDKVVMGPLQLSASVECDHEYTSSYEGVNRFSLGQLSDSTDAFNAAQQPLNHRIAEKIVDYINNCW